MWVGLNDSAGKINVKRKDCTYLSGKFIAAPSAGITRIRFKGYNLRCTTTPVENKYIALQGASQL
jgi:hypothetical protein